MFDEPEGVVLAGLFNDGRDDERVDELSSHPESGVMLPDPGEERFLVHDGINFVDNVREGEDY